MRNFRAAYLQNPWLRWFWEHGGEEPVGPHGPLGYEQFFSPPGHGVPWSLGNPVPWSLSHPVSWSLGHPIPWRSGPHPEPWRIAVAQLIEAAQARDLATKLPDGQLKSELTRSARTAIEALLEEWCWTPPRKPPWPWPGPHPWVWEIVSELSFAANSLQPGSLRDAIENIAIEALQKTGTAE
jgi:hypothetical protein